MFLRRRVLHKGVYDENSGGISSDGENWFCAHKEHTHTYTHIWYL